MNKGQYITKLQSEIDDDSTRARAVLDTALHGALVEIIQSVGKYLIEEQEDTLNTTASQRYVQTVDNFSRISRVFYKAENDDSYKELKPIKQVSYNPNMDDGDPVGFYVLGNRVYFDKKPLSSLDLILITYLPEQEYPDADTDTVPIIDDKYMHVVMSGTIARFMEYEGDDAQQTYRMQFMNDLNNYVNEVSTRDIIKTSNIYGL